MYIGRRLDGTIYGSWSSKQPNDADHPRLEEVDDDNTELLAFLKQDRPAAIDPIGVKIAELESRLVAIETKDQGLGQ